MGIEKKMGIAVWAGRLAQGVSYLGHPGLPKRGTLWKSKAWLLIELCS